MILVQIFIDTEADVRFLRRMKRDLENKGRAPHVVASRYTLHVKPMHDKFVEPSKTHADIVVPNGGYNAKGAIELLAHSIANMIEEKI